MAAPTKYNHLDDDELLNLVDEKRQYSPLIEELCHRLESKNINIPEDHNSRSECPVCEVQLEVSFDGGNNMFELEIQRGA